MSLTKSKTFSNPGYIVHSISVTRKQMDDMLDMIYESHRTGVRFDGTGMFLAALPFQVLPSSKRSTFCSKYIVQVCKNHLPLKK